MDFTKYIQQSYLLQISLCCTSVLKSNLSSLALESNSNCIQEILKTKTIEIGSRIQSGSTICNTGMKPQCLKCFEICNTAKLKI